ncbi:MAG: T9SS type A sorting domain-containing protein, partial [Bacteroidales bacterium]|nr:T9SS type A sorting domain-containing protein [Bacteroidales bacterium]
DDEVVANRDAWTEVAYSTPNAVGDTARGDRNYPAVKITPKVWTSGSGTVAAAMTDVESSNYIYYSDDEGSDHYLGGLALCEGDVIRLATSPTFHLEDDVDDPEYNSETHLPKKRVYDSKFIMWDFDPYYSNPVTYVVPAQNTTVIAYYGPLDYWIDVIDAPAEAGAVYDNNNIYTTRPTPTPAYSSTDGSAKAGYVTTYNGDVHIYDENGLAWFISVVNGLNGTQARPFYFNKVYLHKKADGTDYDMKDHLWTPVGTTQHRFRGWFKGVSATENDTATLPANERVVIKNIILDEDGLENVGFFAFLDTARIYNIELNSVLARGNQYVGALAARSQNAKILNCAVIDDAEGAYVPAAPPAPAQTYTTTILATHYVSGGMIGRSLNDSIVSSQVKAKYVGDAVYSGGIIGYGEGNKAALVDSRARNDNRMNGLYIGGIAGYLNGSAPVNSLAKTAPAMMVANNYVHMTTDGRSQRVGGIVGYATNAIIENNYVYGSLQGSATEGGVGAVLDEGSQSDHNYYEQSAVVKSAGQRRGNAAMSDNTGFSGSGNQVSLGQSVYGLNNLTRVLNRWVREHGNKYKSWRSDLEGVNDGYPYFGQPDLIPVTDDITFNNCDSVEWNGMVFTLDTVLVSHVIDSTEMIDSTSTLRFIIHHSSLTQYFDSSEVGHPYSGYGFELTAAESELLRSTVEQFGSAVLVLGDTLSNSEGCDSIIQLVLTFTDTKAVVMPTQKHINIYPNPTTDRVTVEATGLRRVELYDNEGRRLQDYTAPDRHDSLTIDVSAYASGFYYLRVHDSEGITIQKLIKK